MTTPTTPLTMPPEWRILLTTLEGTDHKIDCLLPLLDLLSDPENAMSELGQALIDALLRISEDLQQASRLREVHREALKVATETNTHLLQTLEGLSAELQATRKENRFMAGRIEEIHDLMFSPEE